MTTISPPSFETLGVSAALTAALTSAGFDQPFPIQTAAWPAAFAGSDLLGKGRTGSGKTLAFTIPVVARLAGDRSEPGRPRALVLAPTRELASQIERVIAPFASAVGLSTVTVFGGVGAGKQTAALRRGVDIVVGCPGRLVDLAGSGDLRLDNIDITVIDEADHMADQGFLPMVRRLLAQTPQASQRLLFSATLDNGVDRLVKEFLTNPVLCEVADSADLSVTLPHHIVNVNDDERFNLLCALAQHPGRTIMFARTKSRARRLCRQLNGAGIDAVELHGNLAQNARERNLASFTANPAGVLVATDIAARGIHVDDIRLVVHADPPVEHKAFVHRSGRTGRAGATGQVVTVTTPEQRTHVNGLLRSAKVSARFVDAGTAPFAVTDWFDSEQAAAPVSPKRRRQPAAKMATSAPAPSPVLVLGDGWVTVNPAPSRRRHR